jgi:hypothetical protein
MIVDDLRMRALLCVEDGDLMREAAARIEVCLEAITEGIGDQDNPAHMLRALQRAHYALLAKHPDDPEFRPPLHRSGAT